MNHFDESMGRPQETKAWLDNAFEPTPEGFRGRLEGRLSMLRGQEAAKPTRKRMRFMSLVLAGALLLGATAYAVSRLGVLYFLTERTSAPADANQVVERAVSPLAQSCESDVLTGEIRDAVFMGDIFSICIHVSPKAPDTYALLCEQSIGTDGEHSQWVWADGAVYESLEEWTPKGKQALVVALPDLTLGGYPLAWSCDYVMEENGVTFLVEVDVSDMEILHGVVLNDLIQANGTAEVVITTNSFVDGAGDGVLTTLTASIPYQPEGESK